MVGFQTSAGAFAGEEVGLIKYQVTSWDYLAALAATTLEAGDQLEFSLSDDIKVNVLVETIDELEGVRRRDEAT